jgi:hypothetical protein
VKRKTFSTLFIFLLVGFSINFFDFKPFIENETLKYIRYFFLISGVVLSLPYVFIKNKKFILPVKIISASIGASFLMAYYSWGQGFSDSLKGTAPYMLWIFFFYLLREKIEIETLEKIILFYGIAYFAAFFFQYYNYSTVYFGYKDEFKFDRGTVRVNFTGEGIYILATLIALVRLKLDKKYRLFFGLICLTSLIVTILQVTRQNIVMLILIFMFEFIRKVSLTRKVLVLGFFAIAAIYFSNSDISIVKGLKEEQNNTMNEDARNNIRYVASAYFLSEYSPNIYSKIFGNGVSFGKSEFAKRDFDLMSSGFYLTDVGIIAFYVMFGVFAVVAFIIIVFTSFKLPLPDRYYYSKYFIWFILGTCLTSASVYHYSFLISTVFALYGMQIKSFKDEKLYTLIV